MIPSSCILQPDNAVAVLGAGPGGLVAARWLLARGLEPVIFEAASRLGGQWNPESPMSGTWPGMRTNTSRVMSAFSDLEHADGTPVYPNQAEMLDYLERYAVRFDLVRRIRFACRVTLLDRAAAGRWRVDSCAGSGERHELFSRVVVATGRYVQPDVPPIDGIAGFTGALGVSHTRQYDGPARYRGRKVVVGGCSISALEIASELALSGAEVTASYRRQRYIVPKLLAGVPTDHVLFNRGAALAAAVMPPAALAQGLKSMILREAGSPQQYGAPPAADDVLAAGIAQSQHFLASVAEGRIAPRPWIAVIDGGTVHFLDGTQCRPDGILLGTGYRLSLPWLAPSLAAAVGLDGQHIDLYDHTFHHEMDGVAFLGLYDQVGPLLPVLELQARWIARVWSDRTAAPSREAVARGVVRAHAARGGPKTVPMHAMALLFARHAGVEPDLARWPALERALLFGPLSPISFRLQGPDSLPDAPARTAAAAAAFGAIATPTFTAEERGLREAILAGPAAAAA